MEIAKRIVGDVIEELRKEIMLKQVLEKVKPYACLYTEAMICQAANTILKSYDHRIDDMMLLNEDNNEPVKKDIILLMI